MAGLIRISNCCNDWFQGAGTCHHWIKICCSSLCSCCWACDTTSKFTSRQNSCFLSPSLSLAVSLTVYGPYSGVILCSVLHIWRKGQMHNCISVSDARGTTSSACIMTCQQKDIQLCKPVCLRPTFNSLHSKPFCAHGANVLHDPCCFRSSQRPSTSALRCCSLAARSNAQGYTRGNKNHRGCDDGKGLL